MKKTFLLVGILILAALLVFIFNFKPGTTEKSAAGTPTPIPLTTNYPSSTSSSQTTPQSSLYIVSSQPENQAKNIPVNQKITITFNRSFSSDEVSFSSSPSFGYTKNISGNTLIITPSTSLQANSVYVYFINYANPKFQGETRSFSTIGNNPQFTDEYGHRIGQITPPPSQSNDSVAILAKNVPHNSATFSITSTVESQQFYFVVKLTGPDKNQDKQDFLTWVKSLGITDAQISSLDIRYQ